MLHHGFNAVAVKERMGMLETAGSTLEYTVCLEEKKRKRDMWLDTGAVLTVSRQDLFIYLFILLRKKKI